MVVDRIAAPVAPPPAYAAAVLAVALAACTESPPVDVPTECRPTQDVVSIEARGSASTPAIGADPDGVWVAFDLRASEVDDSDHDVFLARVACDGEITLPPLRVDSSDGDDIDPTLAVAHERVLVAWSARETRDQPYDTHYRIYHLDGRPAAPTQVIDPARGNNLARFAQPQALATPDGFAIVGSTTLADRPSPSRPFLVELDPDGAALAAPYTTDDPHGDQAYAPVAAVDDAGAVYIAWRISPPRDGGFYHFGSRWQGSARLAELSLDPADTPDPADLDEAIIAAGASTWLIGRSGHPGSIGLHPWRGAPAVQHPASGQPDAFAADARGDRLWLVWRDRVDGQAPLMGQWFEIGDTAQPIGQPIGLDTDAGRAAVALLPEGHAAIAWRAFDLDFTGYRIRFVAP